MKFFYFFIATVFVFFDFSSGGEKYLEKVNIDGVNFVLKQTNGPGIVSGVFFIKGGSVEDPVSKKGLANLTLKLLLKGSKKYSSFEINKFFEDSGGFISASVSEEVSNIEFAVRSEDFVKALEIIRDIFENPAFPEDKLSIEIENTKAQIRAKKEEGFSFAFDKLRSDAFKGTSYEVSPLGREEDLDRITVSDVKQMWKSLYIKERFVVSVVGDLPLDTMKSELSKFRIPSGKSPDIPLVKLDLSKEKCNFYKREGAQSTILILYNAPSVSSEDYFKFKVLNSVLGNGFTSKLFQELREKRGYAYAVGSVYMPRLKFGSMVAYIGTAPEKTQDAIYDMSGVVKSFPEVISEEDVKIAKEKLIGDFLMDHQTRAKQAYYLGWFEMVGLGYEYDQKYPDIIKSITLKDVIEVYKKYIPTGSICTVVKP